MTQTRGRWVYDIEASGLLDHTTVDYTQSPYKLKPNFLIHCICFQDVDTGRTVDFVRTDYPTHDEFRLYVLNFIEEYVQVFVAQNGLDYDWLVLKAYFGIDYFVAGDPVEQDLFNGKPIVFRDTLVMSKLLNSERYGGHSLESWGAEFGFPKINWRQKAIDLGLITKADPKGVEFRVYHPEMLVYCRTDVAITARLFLHLEREMEGWNWLSALLLEQAVRDIITKQSHRGFKFDIKLAQELLVDLDAKMLALKELVEPVIPAKPLTKAKLGLWTPPTRQLIYEKAPQVPKVQIKKDGSPSQAMLRYAEVVGGVIEDYSDVPVEDTSGVLWLRIDDSLYSFSSTVPLEQDTVPFSCIPTLAANIENWVQKHNGLLHYNDDQWYANIEGNDYPLPMVTEPLKQQESASIQDVTHLKGWLCSMGWVPTQFKEKDLTVDTKKTKLTPEKYQETAQRYIDQTLASPFKKFRFEKLDVRSNTQFVNKVLNHRLDRPLKVYTNPSLTVGMSKEIDPAIAAIADKFPYAKQVSEYLTYNHRRNSIASNGFVFDTYDPDDDFNDDDEPDAGFLSSSRIYEDGRIPTPADTNGCNTSRMKHRVVVNVPRPSSLYGEQMRSLFSVADNCLQLGYDFAALESRIQAHYVFRYDTKGQPYCNSLLGDKDLGEDCHTITAKMISEVLGYEFKRDPAKNVAYCCLPVDNTEVMTRSGWKFYKDLTIGEDVLTFNYKNKINEFKPINNIFHYKDAEVVLKGHKWFDFESTPDHRWYGFVRKESGGNHFYVDSVFTTNEITTEHNITNVAPFKTDVVSNVLDHEAELIGWILSDGYYKWSELAEITSSSKGRKKGIICSLSQAEHKFQTEIEECLTKNNISFATDLKNTDNYYSVNSYILKSDQIRNFIDRVVKSRDQKHEVNWCEWLLTLNVSAIQRFLYAFWLGDGDSKNKDFFQDDSVSIRQNRGEIFDVVVLAGYLLGWRVTYTNNQKCTTINFQKIRSHASCQTLKTLSSRTTDVFCLSTSNDTFIIRQGNTITITGNCAYGGSPKKVAQTIGSDFETGKLVHETYWLSAAPLAALKVRLEEYWEKIGQKKFILGLDGRKIPTRSKSSLINALFQSGGTICVKRASVMLDRMIRSQGLMCDFWTEYYRNKTYAQQMIVMHDEQQFELTNNLVTHQFFPVTEWEYNKKNKPFSSTALNAIREFRSTNPNWSSVHQTSEGYELSYSIVGDLALQAVGQAGVYYKLNVPLTAEYATGANWKNCH